MNTNGLREMAYLKKFGGGGSSSDSDVSSYKNLSDKPFESRDINIEYDGSLDNKQIVNINENHTFVKVDDVFSLNKQHMLSINDIKILNLNDTNTQYYYSAFEFVSNDDYKLIMVESYLDENFEQFATLTAILIAMKDCVVNELFLISNNGEPIIINDVYFKQGVWVNNINFDDYKYIVSKLSITVFNQIENQDVAPHICVVDLIYNQMEDKHSLNKSFDEIFKLIHHGYYILLRNKDSHNYFFLTYSGNHTEGIRMLIFNDLGVTGYTEVYQNTKDDNGKRLATLAYNGTKTIKIIENGNDIDVIIERNRPLHSINMITKSGKVFKISINDDGTLQANDVSIYHDNFDWYK